MLYFCEKCYWNLHRDCVDLWIALSKAWNLEKTNMLEIYWSKMLHLMFLIFFFLKSRTGNIIISRDRLKRSAWKEYCITELLCKKIRLWISNDSINCYWWVDFWLRQKNAWGVPIVTQRKWTWYVSMRMWVPFLASLSGLRFWHYLELWCKLRKWLRFAISMAVAIAPIRPLAWELPYATPATLKRKKKKKLESKITWALSNILVSIL